MKILIACEFSGIVREAFGRKGHQVWSCDLLPSEKACRETTHHYQGDVMNIINDGWDMMIAFPPCTYLTVTANRSFLNNPERWKRRLDAVMFVYQLINADIDKICIENPVGVISTHIRKPEQYLQPFQFGHPFSKKTCLWLKNLPALIPTEKVDPVWITRGDGKRYSPQHELLRGRDRSTSFQGIANAMAAQWG